MKTVKNKKKQSKSMKIEERTKKNEEEKRDGKTSENR